MNTPHSFSDEDLTAFLDGEAPDALHAAIETALDSDQILANRMAALDVPLDPIVSAYDALLELSLIHI